MPCLLTNLEIEAILKKLPSHFSTEDFIEACPFPINTGKWRCPHAKPPATNHIPCGKRLAVYARTEHAQIERDPDLLHMSPARWRKTNAAQDRKGVIHSASKGNKKAIKPPPTGPLDIGPQYGRDDAFRRRARWHQSKYRAHVLGVGFNEYGNRLQDADAIRGLNYYDSLGVREEKTNIYPNYSANRDADMLRSEHIPVNLFVPLRQDKKLAKRILMKWFPSIDFVEHVEIEYAPDPNEEYLDDNTSFDAYVVFQGKDKKKHGIGIEVKYTEGHYQIGDGERDQIADPESPYHRISRASGLYIPDALPHLYQNQCRQMWRNHLLGESMRLNTSPEKQKPHCDIDSFTSVFLYPNGNTHASHSVAAYLTLLKPEKRNTFIPIKLEEFIPRYLEDSDDEVKKLGKFLHKRYLICTDDKCRIVPGGH